MEINKILKISNIGIFRDYSWKSDKANEFKKYNAIYGWNGSGKTTLSRIFDLIATGKNNRLKITQDSECLVQTSVGQIRLSKDNVDIIDNLRVFNEDFVEDNLEWNGTKAKPILIVGEKNIKQKQELEALKKQKYEIAQELRNQREAIGKIEEERRRLCLKVRDNVKNELIDFRDINPYGPSANFYLNYNIGTVAGLFDCGIDFQKLNAEEIVDRKKSLADRDSLSMISEFIPDIGNLVELFKTGRNILATPLTEKINTSLKEETAGNNALLNWIKIGHDLHSQENKPVTCKFCRNEIVDERLSEINDFFDVSWDNLSREIDKILSEIHSTELSTPVNAKEYYLELQNEAASANQDYLLLSSEFTEGLKLLSEQLILKQQAPFKVFNFDITVYETKATNLTNVVQKINEIILGHNTKTSNFQSRRTEIAHSIELAIFANYKEDYLRVKNELVSANNELNSRVRLLAEIETSIQRIEEELNESFLGGEEMNILLSLFLGRKDIQFTSVDGGYLIKRDGSPAHNLSEGERNAIALIFFLTKLKEDSLTAEQSIIVIDDPISSFDSQFLHQAIGFIKARISEIKPCQLFVFTHNFQFFRQIRLWFKHQKGGQEYYMLNSLIDPDGKRHATIKDLDVLLKENDSEYAYLFKRVYNRSKQVSSDLYEDYILPNVLRKVLENYLSFKVPRKGVNLHARLITLFDDYKPKIDISARNRIESYTQDNSHPLYQDSPQDFDERLLGEMRTACSDIIKLIKETDPMHYKNLLIDIGV